MPGGYGLCAGERCRGGRLMIGVVILLGIVIVALIMVGVRESGGAWDE